AVGIGWRCRRNGTHWKLWCARRRGHLPGRDRRDKSRQRLRLRLRGGGGGAADTLSGCVVKEKPRPRLANGPVISAATSTFFTARRASSAGLMRGRISLNGRLTRCVV